ncbi:MAG TPA: hypothetical protein DC036_02995, partial [Alphaproteobacteria bacterium]|nr:hypothetical protein [Alphaproteobacteria bacterium]
DPQAPDPQASDPKAPDPKAPDLLVLGSRVLESRVYLLSAGFLSACRSRIVYDPGQWSSQVIPTCYPGIT